MSQKFLHRDDAPFAESIWEKIDSAVIGAVKSQLSARRLLHVDGPYGLGLKDVPGSDESVEGKGQHAELSVSRPRPVAMIRREFALPIRDVASYEQSGLSLDLSAAVEAALAVARQEDDLLFNGNKNIGVDGLLSVKGAQRFELKDWNDTGVAAGQLIAAVTLLDQAGYHGPFTLALSPDRYNLLLRRYPQGNMSEIEHARTIIDGNIVKAPSIKSGGVLIASGRQYASVTLGQDIATGFVGPEENDYAFFISESIALRVAVPEAICVLK